MFATAKGLVRRNSMDAFTNIPTAGKIAMRFEEGSADRLIGVALLSEEDDVLLASRGGKAIRFMGSDIREFQSRTAIGVRGMALREDDEVISLTILHRSGATADEREAYLRAAPWKGNDNVPTLDAERMVDMAEREQFILTVCANGYGKLTSAYEYRRTGRGGQGITNIDLSGKFEERNGPVLASFPVKHGEQIMLVTDQAKLIRLPIELKSREDDGETREGLSIKGRNTAGMRLFKVADNEHVVSAARIAADADDDNAADDAEGPTADA